MPMRTSFSSAPVGSCSSVIAAAELELDASSGCKSVSAMFNRFEEDSSSVSMEPRSPLLFFLTILPVIDV